MLPVKSLIEIEIDRIVRRNNELDEREKSLVEKQTQLTSSTLWTFKSEPVVYLNVGGTIFNTTLTSLRQYPGSRLEIIFSGRHEVLKDKNQDYFIDRDGDLFQYVINFLRDGKLDTPNTPAEVELLRLEFEYYGIPYAPLASMEAASNWSQIHLVPATENIYHLLQEREKHLGALEKSLEDQEEAIKTEQALVDDTNQRTKDQIRLNVGGMHFTTSRQTLCFRKNTVLFHMFHPESKHTIAKDRQGNFFLDRDGNKFRFVLNYLRNSGGCKIPVELKNEFDWFGMVVPENALVVETRLEKFVFHYDWDEDGLFCSLAKKGLSDKVVVTASTGQDINGVSNNLILQREARVWQVYGIGAWFCIDLSRVGEFQLNHYTIRHRPDWGSTALRWWKIEGSPDGKCWHTIISHENDTKIEEKRLAVASWSVPANGCQFYRLFKLVMTGKASRDHYFLNLSNIEFYGQLKVCQ